MYNYPKYKSEYGNLTEKFRDRYLKFRIEKGLLNEKIIEKKNLRNLIASNDINDEIFFWQLFSVLGTKKINKIVETFYIKIFNDKKFTWFKNEFIESGNIEYHINGQKNFWLDIMGGGKYYSDESKLDKKHNMVKNIMIEEASNIWLNYMLETLNELEINKMEDIRIFDCLKEFINYFMYLYSNEFNFNYVYNSKL